MRSRAVAFTLMAAFAGSAPAPAQTPELEHLRELAGLSMKEWQAVNLGEVHAAVLDTQEKREVAIIGVARLHANVECFVNLFQDIEHFKMTDDILRIQKLPSPLQLRDLQEFNLEPSDISALKKCKVGDCGVKLPVSAIERINRSVDWNRPDHAAKVEAIIREEIFSYVQTYFARGNPALIEYHDTESPLRMEDDFRGLLDGRPRVADFAPEFQTYLARYPNQKLNGVSDFLYWSAESFGLGPVTSLTHVSVYTRPGQVVAASKQIFASHYFDSSLGLTVAVADPRATSVPSMYLLYVNRSRIDLLGGFFGGLQRALTRGRMREGMRKRLTGAVQNLEASCGANPAAPSRAQ